MLPDESAAKARRVGCVSTMKAKGAWSSRCCETGAPSDPRTRMCGTSGNGGLFPNCTMGAFPGTCVSGEKDVSLIHVPSGAVNWNAPSRVRAGRVPARGGPLLQPTAVPSLALLPLQALRERRLALPGRSAVSAYWDSCLIAR